MESFSGQLPLLVKKTAENDPHTDIGAVERAYAYAMDKHSTTKRLSGEPYFCHPLRIANELAALGMDHQTVVTALLHDVVEDTDTTANEIKTLFGDEIAKLVTGVTKLSHFESMKTGPSSAENFSKLLLASADDLRVMLVKLYDRLDNMRTLHFIEKPKKRFRIARETDEIYVPIAHRLGMQEIKDELEDLAFANLNPSRRDSILRRSGTVIRLDPLLRKRIEKALYVMLSDNGLNADVRGRIKAPASIDKKLQQKSVDLNALSDLIGFRVILENVEDCYRALGIFHSSYKAIPGRLKDHKRFY